MASICHACATDITDTPLSCKGFCKAEFHLKCSKISSTVLEEMKRNIQLVWMCQSCAKLMDNIRIRSSIRAAFEAGQDNVLSTHSEIVNDLKSEIMIELRNEIRSNFTALINSSSHTPKSSVRPMKVERSLRSRRLFHRSEVAERRQHDLMSGTGKSLSPSVGNFTVPPPSQKFWVYLSRISRDVTADQMCELAKHRLATNDVEAVRLVANGKDINTLSFISFKIGINSDLKAKALDPSTWPKGMLFREFKDNKSAANFWKPNRSPSGDSSPGNLSPSHSNPQDDVMVE